MKKKLILLIAAIVILGVLLGLYAFGSKDGGGDVQQDSTEEEVVTPQTYTLMDREMSEISRVTISANQKEIVYLPKDNTFTVEGYEDADLSQINVESVVSSFAKLYSSNVVVDNPEDLSVYGLENPSAVGTGEYTDGTKAVIYIGDITPDKSYYYAMLEGDTKVYLIDVLSGGRFYYNIGQLLNTNISTINKDTVTYINIQQKGKDEILIVYDENDSNVNENLKNNGLFTLSMKKPIDGVLVYPYNLQSYMLSSLASIVVKDVIDVTPENLADYGLDDPILRVTLKDNSNSLKMIVGNDIDDNTVYVMVNDRPEVFSMSKAAILSFMDVNITDFIQKFVALHTRSKVEKIDIKSVYGDYNIKFVTKGENMVTENGEGVADDKRITYINDTEIERESFTNFYELLVGITFDALDKEAAATGEPQVSIGYTMTDGDVDMVQFYNYNENFYVAKKGENSSMVVSKQSVKQVIDKARELSE